MVLRKSGSLSARAATPLATPADTVQLNALAAALQMFVSRQWGNEEAAGSLDNFQARPLPLWFDPDGSGPTLPEHSARFPPNA